jgi:hypothetical protein
VRKKKLEIVQLWRCASCKRVFTPGPAALRNKTYPLRTILAALSDYDLGYSVQMTATHLRKKTGRHVSPSTWLHQYQQHCMYHRLRFDGLKQFPPEQTIRSIKLYHRQIYAYAYDRPKLEFMRAGTLDDKRTGDTRFGPVADFLESIPTYLSARSISTRGRPESSCIAGTSIICRRLAHCRELKT